MFNAPDSVRAEIAYRRERALLERRPLLPRRPLIRKPWGSHSTDAA
jgi:hypothetical protein